MTPQPSETDDGPGPEVQSRTELEEQTMTEQDNDHDRRTVLGGLIAAGAAVVGYGIGTQEAAASGGGTVANRANPADAIYSERLQLVDNNPSEPENGDFWYQE